jgi:hypothetical protein
MGYSAAVIPVRGENRNRVFKMTFKMLARIQIGKRKKRHGIKRLPQEQSKRHSRCMSPFLALNGRGDTHLTCLVAPHVRSEIANRCHGYRRKLAPAQFKAERLREMSLRDRAVGARDGERLVDRLLLLLSPATGRQLPQRRNRCTNTFNSSCRRCQWPCARSTIRRSRCGGSRG